MEVKVLRIEHPFVVDGYRQREEIPAYRCSVRWLGDRERTYHNPISRALTAEFLRTFRSASFCSGLPTPTTLSWRLVGFLLFLRILSALASPLSSSSVSSYSDTMPSSSEDGGGCCEVCSSDSLSKFFVSPPSKFCSRYLSWWAPESKDSCKLDESVDRQWLRSRSLTSIICRQLDSVPGFSVRRMAGAIQHVPASWESSSYF